MKQANRAAQEQTARPGRNGRKRGVRNGRHGMNRHLRRFLVLILLVLMFSSLFAGYASLYPVDFTVPTPVFGYSRTADVCYEVLLRPNSFTDQQTIGMGQTYLRDFADSVNISYLYSLQAAQASSIQYNYRIDAVVRVHDAASPQKILLTRQIALQPETTGEISGADLKLESSVAVSLADFESIITDFKKQTSQQATFDLAVTMSVRTSSGLFFGPYASSDTVSVVIPLDQSQFTIAVEQPSLLPAVQLQPVLYRIVLSELPMAVYPAMAGACFLVLVLLLTVTRSSKKNKFDRQLRKLLKMGRSQLMLIGDKAWEPEWCVTASDFRSMVRTARKLKHPIFCYVDRSSASPVAYFYIYYGENNYCYTFGQTAAASPDTGDETPLMPDLPDLPLGGGPADSFEPDEGIPLLPETDDSPEIMLANLRIQSGFGHSSL